MPLTMVGLGEAGCIRQLRCRDEQKRHLENLGFVIGEKVSVISEIGGDMIVQVKGARFAISKTMASKIIM